MFEWVHSIPVTYASLIDFLKSIHTVLGKARVKQLILKTLRKLEAIVPIFDYSRARPSPDGMIGYCHSNVSDDSHVYSFPTGIEKYR